MDSEDRFMKVIMVIVIAIGIGMTVGTIYNISKGNNPLDVYSIIFTSE